MTRASLLSLLLAAATLFAAQSSSATILHFSATLDGATEDPPVPSAGTGTASVTFDDVAHLLTVEVDFSGLTGNTTVAHIHCCTAIPMAGTVGVATFPGTFPGFPAGVTSGSYVGSWMLDDPASFTAAFLNTFGGGTAAGAEAALIQGIFDGKAYVNIHTTFAPGGEIRGFLVPEPGTILLLALGFGATFVARRRGRR